MTNILKRSLGKGMKYDNLIYERPDYADVAKRIEKATQKIRNAQSREDFFAAVFEADAIKRETDFAMFMMFSAYYHDATDAKAAEELAYISAFDEKIDMTSFNEAILSSQFEKDYIEKYGDFLIRTLESENRLKADGAEEMAREQELIIQYQSIKPSLNYKYRGKDISAGELEVLMESSDRSVRIDARDARDKAFLEKKDEIAAILDELIKLRDSYAKKNGFDNFLDYNNVKKGRFEYGEQELLDFCNLVKRELLPLEKRVRESLKKEMGLDKFTPYDDGVLPPGKEVHVTYDYNEMLDRMQKMYDDMDSDFGELLRTMRNNGYIDAAPSPNKTTGMAFTIMDAKNKSPYIFANCEPYSETVNELVHEFGHCIQHYLTENALGLLSSNYMPQDLVEIPSKFMELMLLSHADLFFGKEAVFYREKRLNTFLHEIIAFCMYAEIEHYLYTHVDASFEERTAFVENIKKEYYVGMDEPYTAYSKYGTWLLDNMPIFALPGYVICYSLCDISAIFLAAIYNKNKEEGLRLYKKFCSLGRSLDYESAMNSIGLASAFKEESVRSVRDFFESAFLN